jgi:hypothetical protein
MFRWSSARSGALLESLQALLSTVTTMGYFGFLSGPPFSSAATSLLIVMLSPALKGDEGEPASNWPLRRHERHDLKKNTAPARF